MLRWVSFKVLLHFILKFKPFDMFCNVFRFKMWLQTYLRVSEAIIWRFFQCLLQNDKGLLRGFPSLNLKVKVQTV